MTVICGGGASEAKPEFARFLFVGPAVIGGLLSRIPARWAGFFGGLIGGITYDLSTFCLTDPPAVPALTSADALAILNPLDPIAKSNALLKIEQLIAAYIWYDLCKCSAVATPAPPAAPAKPADWPDVNPPTLPNETNSACDAVVSPTVQMLSNSNSPRFFGTRASAGGFGPHWTAIGATVARFTVTYTSAGGTHSPQMKIYFWPTNAITETVATVHQQGYGVSTFDLPFPAGFNMGFVVEAVTEPYLPNCTDTVQVNVDVYCGGAPNALLTPCCPPDMSLAAQVQELLEIVTLIQRQVAPFAYVPGAVHATLSGTGHFSIQGLLGVKVDITTLPPEIGNQAGTPPQLFDAGYVTFGTADGYDHSWRVEHDPTLILPVRCSAYTDVGYTLAPGVVVTITELARER